MIGQKAHHKSFSVGTITGLDGTLLSVSFSAGEKKFVYPDAFASFLTAADTELQDKALAALQEKQNMASTITTVNTRGANSARE